MIKINLKLILISMMIVFTLTACDATSNENTAVTSISEAAEAVETIEAAQIDQSDLFDDFIATFREKLKANNLDIGDAVPKDASAIGAISGYGFSINYIPFEMYLFDPDSTDPKAIENINTAQNESYITFFGIEINGKVVSSKCFINQNAILVFPTEDMVGPHPNKLEIIDAFSSI